MKREADLERELCRRVAGVRGVAVKVAFPGVRGAPDRLLLLPGRAVWVEVKHPVHGRLTPQQRRIHALLKQSGMKVFVLNDKDDIDRILYGL